jgi:hypothetical protein
MSAGRGLRNFTTVIVVSKNSVAPELGVADRAEDVEKVFRDLRQSVDSRFLGSYLY